jgi:hypothetical protein
VVERIGEEPARAAFLVEPLELAAAQREDAAQDHLADAIGVLLRVRERERAAPRAAEHLPALDAEVLAQRFHVGDQVPGGVVFERRMRSAATAAALVEEHDPVARGIPEASLGGRGAAARAAMHEQRGLAGGVAVLLEVDLVRRVDCQAARVERSDFRIGVAQR